MRRGGARLPRLLRALERRTEVRRWAFIRPRVRKRLQFSSAFQQKASPVNEPLTEHLLSELINSSDPKAFVESRTLDAPTLTQYLNHLLQDRGMKYKEVARAADLDETYAWYIFAGRRNPTRNKLLQIAFGMRLTVQETQRLLQAGGISRLYPKNRRDAIIIYSLQKGATLLQAEGELYGFGKQTIIEN